MDESKNNGGLDYWYALCWKIINENPYAEEMKKGTNDLDRFTELGVKSKIYHTALYEYSLKLKERMRKEQG